MTDGIIQQVFKRYNMIYNADKTICDRIQQELIEKIKQEYSNCPHKYRGYCCHEHSIVEKLIGDNKE